MRKRKEMRKKEKKGKENKREENKYVRGKKEKLERREKGESGSCTLLFQVFRQLKVFSPIIKISVLDESYE